MKVEEFDLSRTLECGQCFNFEKTGENEYIVVAYGRMLHVRQEKADLEFLNASDEDINNIWIPYFDLYRDYKKINEEIIKADPRLKEIIDKYNGIRILNQDFTETLISFIISQNKNITHIKQLIRNLSVSHGIYIGSFDGRRYYSFPELSELEKISEEEFRDLKVGFRAPYLCDAVRRLSSGGITEQMLKGMTYEEAKEKLKTIKGVGDKVANCVLLFSLGFRSAFPVDIWIKRVTEKMYGTDADAAAALFGRYGGYAQQYLFMYARENLQFFTKKTK